MSCGVYKITNKLTGECYVGSSKDIEYRFQQHKQRCYWRKRPNNLLYKAFQEYGLENFSFDIIELCDESALYDREDFHMLNGPHEYNVLRAQHNTEKSRKEWYAKYHETEAYKKKLEYTKQWKNMHPESLEYKKYEEYRAKNREASKKWRERKKLEKERQKQMLVLAAETQENPIIEGTLLQNKKSRQLK